jgi:23S rRNA pseudouridine1911/1915/1917 synthase
MHDVRLREEAKVHTRTTREERQFDIVAGSGAAVGMRIDAYLTALFPRFTRSLVQKWFARGYITVDGKPARRGLKLRGGESIAVRAPLPRSDRESDRQPLDLVYADDHLIAINKPPGQLCHPAGKVFVGTLLNQLQDWCHAQGIDDRDLALINRIDRDTSGLILAGLTKQALADVCDQIREHTVYKESRLLCHGVPADEHGHWRDPIGDPPPGRIGKAVRPDGLPSHTEYWIEDRAPEDRYALLRIRLHTGRQHQIRLHAAHHGHPLVGDWVYGAPCEELGGQALHAAAMRFRHPASGEQLALEAPLPAALSQLWLRLKNGVTTTPRVLDASERSRLDLDRGTAPTGSWRRPSWISAEDFRALQQHTGEETLPFGTTDLIDDT